MREKTERKEREGILKLPKNGIILFLSLVPVMAGGCEQVFWGPAESITGNCIYEDVALTGWSTMWQGMCGEQFVSIYANTQPYDALLEHEFDLTLYTGKFGEDGNYTRGSTVLLSNSNTECFDGNNRAGYSPTGSFGANVWIKIGDLEVLPHEDFTVTLDDNEGPLSCTAKLEMTRDSDTEYTSENYVDDVLEIL